MKCKTQLLLLIYGSPFYVINTSYKLLNGFSFYDPLVYEVKKAAVDFVWAFSFITGTVLQFTRIFFEM